MSSYTSQDIPLDYADYDGLLQLARNAGERLAKVWIPRLCHQLKKEHPEMSNDDIKETVKNDCKSTWSRVTIDMYIPEEYKDPQKRAAGIKGREKQLEEEQKSALVVRAENGSKSSTEQESESFENADRGPNVRRESATVHQLQNELKNVRETYEEKLKEEREKLKFAQAPENLEKIPEILDDIVGPIKMQNLSKVSEFDKRGFQILAGRYTEIIKKKLANDGNARITFYIVARDRITKVESLVPVKFMIDWDNKKAEVILDESKL